MNAFCLYIIGERWHGVEGRKKVWQEWNTLVTTPDHD
jgi:hypothetical protein